MSATSLVRRLVIPARPPHRSGGWHLARGQLTLTVGAIGRGAANVLAAVWATAQDPGAGPHPVVAVRAPGSRARQITFAARADAEHPAPFARDVATVRALRG